MAVVHDLPITDAKVDTLAEYHDNPRQGDVAAIAESLRKIGQYRPIVVNKGTHTGRKNEVLAGNHTLRAAKSLGWATVKAVHLDVDDETATRIVLADNKTADLGDYDEALLAQLLTDLPDLEGTGFSDEELDDLLADMREAASDAASAAVGGGDDDYEPDEGEEAPARKFDPETDPGMANKKSLDEKLEGYSVSDTRSIILSYQGDTYVWMVEKLAEIGDKLGTETNADTVRRMVEDAVGEQAPGVDEGDE